MREFNNLKINTRLLCGFILSALIAGYAGYMTGNQSSNTMLIIVVAAVAVVGLGIMIAQTITKPIDQLVEAVDQLAKGNININLVADTQDEIGKLSGSLAGMVEAVKALALDTNLLVKAAIEGKLEYRADATKHCGEFRAIVEGVNNTLDAVSGPLNVAAEYAERISKGEIPAKITDNYNGDFDKIKNNLNACIDELGGLEECSAVLKKLSNNDYTNRVDGKYQGIFAETAKGINTFRNRVRAAVEVTIHMANGDFSEDLDKYKKIGPLCDKDTLIPSFVMCMENIQRLVGDAKMMAEAAVDGRLDARIDITQHQGEYRRVVEGINYTLDAVIGPLHVAAEYVERIGKGDIPAKITDSYNGDFNEIKTNLNACIDGLGGLVECSAVLKKMAVNDYSDKVEGQYQGIFAETAQGVNTARHRLVKAVKVNTNISVGDFAEDLDYFTKIARLSDQDRLIPSYTKSMESVMNLVTEARMLAEAAVAGKLNVRADATKHQGEYRKVVEGFNDTLDALIGPLNMAAEYVDRISKGEIPPKINNSYNGDFNQIKNNLNDCIDGLGGLVECSAVLTNMAGNDYTYKVEGQYQGIFAQTAEAVNTVRIRLLRVVEVNTNISIGNFAHELELFRSIGRRCEADQLIPSYTRSMENIQRLVDDAVMMAQAAVDGRLDVRVDVSQHQGEYKKVVEGINNTMDAVTRVLKITMDNLLKIGNGDIPEIITRDYKGDYNNVKDSVNACISGLGGLVESAAVLQRLAINDHSVKVEGQYQGIYAETAEGVNLVRERLLSAVETNINIANGDFSADLEGFRKIGKRCEQDKLVPSFIMSMENIERLVGDARMLADATTAGNLGVRADVTQHQGDYRRVIEGVNATMDALIGPLNMAADYIERIAHGNTPPKITDNYNGDYNTIKNNLNTCIESIGILVEEVGVAINAGVEGKLDQRANANRGQGVWHNILAGVNAALDAVIEPLIMAADYIERIAAGNTPPKITDSYNGDFNTIKNNLNTCIESIGILVEEIGVAINAGVEGKLDQRANANRGQGVYHKILSGVNATMDALIAPVNEALRVINEMAQGRLSIKMTGNYQGDNAKLKNELNATIDSLAYVIGEVSETLGQISNGNLDISLDKDFQGDFISISSAIKNIIDSLNEVMGDINHASEQVASGSEQVSDSAQALAQGANEQASAIEQLTSAITEIAAQTRQNASSANKANELALNARDNAAQGNEQMKEMLNAMEGINDSSANISKIIKVIDEIAFQTNILALNAAVEAARAGQHGKGFAVVAEEVRNLAARSASAAKETTDLIEGSIRKVQSGTKIANETALALNKIVDGVSQAAVLVGDIAVASNEQATGIALVDQGIGQVSQVVQTNSATAEQSAAASEELSGQAGLLKERVARFELRGRKNNYQETDYKFSAQNRRRQDSSFYRTGLKEAAAASSLKARITLDDGDFGKY